MKLRIMYWINTTNESRDVYPSLGTIIGQNNKSGIMTDCNFSMTNELKYYKKGFGSWYDQSGRCFAFSDGMIGHQE